MKEFNNKLIKTILLSIVTIFVSIILILFFENGSQVQFGIVASTIGLTLIFSVLLVLFRIQEKRKIEFGKILNSIEKSPSELLKWLRRNNEWLEWILKTEDKTILASFGNDYDGSLSEAKLKSLKLYKSFEKTYNGEWNDVNRFFRLIPSYFVSSEYRKLLYKSKEIEENINTSFYAFSENHIQSQEHILTLRRQTRELIRVVYLLMNELYKLNNQQFAEIIAPLREMKIIIELRKRRKFFEDVRMTVDLFDSIVGLEKGGRRKLLDKIKKTYSIFSDDISDEMNEVFLDKFPKKNNL